ncbi:MAG: spermine synthase, partial [Gammaproteobacteria bacterium]|nr:spermine synthase [Gammaproteobacteria bacterium]
EDARLLRLAHEANPQDRWIGFALADAMYGTLEQARAGGRSEHDALRAILDIRPDHAETLRRLWHLERNAGDSTAAEQYRARLAQVSPLDKEVRGVK